MTVDEYESRQERYDTELQEVGINIEGLSSEEKTKALRDYREARYEKLVNAVYKRRGWSENGIPTLETVKRLKIDFPEIVDLIKQNM